MGKLLKLDKPCLNRSVLRSLRKIMQDDYSDVLQNFLDESLSHYSQIHEAWEQENYEQLKIASGLFRESCASIGAECLSELAEKVEQDCRSGHYSGVNELISEIDKFYEDSRKVFKKEQEKYSNKLAS